MVQEPSGGVNSNHAALESRPLPKPRTRIVSVVTTTTMPKAITSVFQVSLNRGRGGETGMVRTLFARGFADASSSDSGCGGEAGREYTGCGAGAPPVSTGGSEVGEPGELPVSTGGVEA